ncbi:MAG: aldehyde ferredoxin oxidoreductase family protein [Chloroflexota bacterium]
MTQLGGYVGRFLFVDLTRGEWTEERPEESLLRHFIGGYGLGAKILYERLPADVDPLGPENMLGFVTGPLTGTPAIMASRYCAVGKSPLTGGWGDANSGGEFGPALKFAGYDAVFFSGAAAEPAYLLIENGRAGLHPAADLWGLDAIETEEALQARHGDDARVACIGPAGERVSLIACIINDRGRAAGRSGLGAVMGSKKLKAVVVRGAAKPHVVHPEQVRALRKKYLPLFQKGGSAEIMRNFGTPGFTRALTTIGRTPIKNWGGFYPDDYPNPDAVDGPAVVAYEAKKYACWHCNQACGGIVRWESGGQVYEGHKPEYETLATLGTYCGIEDLEATMNMNEMCNRAGFDTISAGSTIAFAMECYQNGLFSAEQLDGLELAWGNGAAATELLQRMIERRGLGDILADGTLRAAQRIGQGSQAFAIHSGGQELPAHDPRHAADFGLIYQISPTPGRHTQGGMGAANMPPEQIALYGLDASLKESDPVRFHALAYAAATAWKNVLNAAGLCSFGTMTMPPEYVPEFLAAVTGWDVDMAECVQTGERIETMRHLYGLREGYNPLQVQVAPRAMGRPPLPGGPRAGVTVDVDAVRAIYLERMAWHPVTAVPSPERLVDLGLKEPVDRV